MPEIENHTPGPWVVRQFPTGANARGALWVTDVIPDHDGKVVANAICSVAMTNDDAAANAELIASAPAMVAEIDHLRAENQRLTAEVISVLWLLDGLAEQWGDEAVFRRCRDRLRVLTTEGGSNVEDDA